MGRICTGSVELTGKKRKTGSWLKPFHARSDGPKDGKMQSGLQVLCVVLALCIAEREGIQRQAEGLRIIFRMKGGDMGLKGIHGGIFAPGTQTETGNVASVDPLLAVCVFTGPGNRFFG